MNLLINTATNFSTYYSLDTNDNGIRVSEKSCLNKIFELVSSHSISADNIILANQNGDRIKISIFGTLF